MSKIKVGILILSYNAGELLQRTLERIPPLKDTFEVEILIADDASTIPTVETLNLSRFNLGTPIEICKHLKNLGYGGNQKFGYNYAIERHWEYVVLLHGDGQYAPEILESLLDDLISDKAKVLQRVIDKEGLTLEDSIAVGDSEGDITLMKMVQKPICFNPNARLYAQAKRHGWTVVVERKDVIYKM